MLFSAVAELLTYLVTWSLLNHFYPSQGRQHMQLVETTVSLES